MGQRLGTPISGNLINCTGYVVTINGITGLGTNVAAFLANNLPSAVSTFLGTPSSANLRSALTDETGTGAAVFANSPNIIGTSTNDSAAAGSIGEVITATATQALSSGSVVNVTSITLTAGDWDLSGMLRYSTAGATTTTDVTSAIATANNVVSGGSLVDFFAQTRVASTTDFATTHTFAPTRISISGNTTYYLNCQGTFAISTASAIGRIRARRMR